jgi:hypothetical protein
LSCTCLHSLYQTKSSWVVHVFTLRIRPSLLELYMSSLFVSDQVFLSCTCLHFLYQTKSSWVVHVFTLCIRPNLLELYMSSLFVSDQVFLSCTCLHSLYQTKSSILRHREHIIGSVSLHSDNSDKERGRGCRWGDLILMRLIIWWIHWGKIVKSLPHIEK